MNRATMLNSNIGEYRVTDFLSAGGMGEVYRAVHNKIGQVVAIKVLLQESRDAASNQRFAWEAQVQARLNHPNIAAFHGLTEHQGCPCIVMEYVDGQTLSDQIRFSGPLAIHEALTVFQSVVEAVAYIHAQGIIHRDLKSNNVKITSDGRVKLLDFGIASSALAPKMTMAGLVVGALESLSPEQLQGQRADERSDIWALGVLLYEMVTGRVPFEAQSVGEICNKTSKGSYPPPAMLNPSITREAELLIARCLKRNPADRHQSAIALLDDTRRAVANLSARKPQLLKHSISWQSRVTRQWRIVLLPLLALLIVATIYFLPSPSALLAGPSRMVTIRTTEGPAGVYRNGSYIGETPLKVEVPSSMRVELMLKREGYRQREFTIQANEGSNEYDYTLEKIDHGNR